MNSWVKAPRHGHLTWEGIVTLIAVVLNLATGWGAASPESDPDELQVQVGRTVEITSSHRYCWFPTVHQFASGEIMATMTMTPDEGNPEGEFTAYCISKDGGKTWSARYTMGAGASPSAFSQNPRPDGSIWQLEGGVDSQVSEPTKHLLLTLTKFSRGGMEVTQWRDVPLRTSLPVHIARTELFDRRVQDGHLGMYPAFGPFGPIMEALNGDLMTPACYTAERDQRYYRLVLIRSSDGGKSWSEYATIAAVEPGEKPWPGMGSEGPCEAGMVRLADKRLYAIFRTGGDLLTIGQAWSSDDGKTWTKPTSTPHKGVALRVRRLSNGVLACTTGRPGPVVVMFSVDGTGEEWSQVTPLFKGKSTRYTDFIEVEPGRLLVVYDSVPYAWHAIPYSDRESKNAIYGTFVDVRKVTYPSPGEHKLRISLAGKQDSQQEIAASAGEGQRMGDALASPGRTPGEVQENPKDGLKYVWIPAGTFTMGCSPGDNECYDDEKPSHRVTLRKGFWIGRTEVTVGAYKRFAAASGRQMPESPDSNSDWANDNMPIVNVSWNDASSYCSWAGGRLPTEAEWEYAARGGGTGSRYGEIDEVAWYNGNGGGQQEVGRKRANGFGLFDVLGNVWEWVSDWYDENYYQHGRSEDPSGPAGGSLRVMRGGSFGSYPGLARVSYRERINPVAGYYGVGFRCARESAGK